MYLRTVKKRIIDFEYFIARKMLKNEVEGKKVSRPIVRISIISISLAMLVNIITIAVVTGFQQEVRQKVIGFAAHAIILSETSSSVFEANPILIQQDFYPNILQEKEVTQIHPVAYKPALLQSDKNAQGEQKKEIQGVVVKGVSETYDWTFFQENLISGKVPSFKKDTESDEILISSRIARDLNYKVGDQARAFFVKNKPVKMMFTIVGIFETGLEDFDKELIVGDIRHIQRLNDWGIQTAIRVEDSLANGHLIISAEAIGGNGNYRYDWGKGYDNYRGFAFFPTQDTVIRLVVSDYWMFMDGRGEQTTIPDTAYLKVTVKGEKQAYFPYPTDSEGNLKRSFLNEDGTKFEIKTAGKTIQFERIDGKGSYHNYIGAFELAFRDWDNLENDIASIRRKISLRKPNEGEMLKVKSILETQSDIFVWLSFLDINVWIILTLMIIIGIINMGSALLVMILIRTHFIGLMKALGASNWSIRKIFLYQASFLIGKGMLWGNLIGIGFCFLQDKFHIFKLNPEIYYLSSVPIQLDVMHVILLNVATFCVCVLALIIPSFVITRIQPVKAIRFN
jgi:lipoprotein-releasing system permease protein